MFIKLQNKCSNEKIEMKYQFNIAYALKYNTYV